MALTNVHSSSDQLDVVRELRSIMEGKVISRGYDGYATTRQLWNAAVQHQSEIFAVCQPSDDVQAAVRTARDYGLSVSVRDGGHDYRRLARRCGLPHGGVTAAR